MSVGTIPVLFRMQAERFGPRVALRRKLHGLYGDITWNEHRASVDACARALIAAGIASGDRVAILSENRVEWLIADMAILSAGAVNVPLHAPLSAAQAQYQLDNAGVKWIFVSNISQYRKIEEIRAQIPGVSGIVIFDDAASVQAIPWRGFLQRGRSAEPSIAAELSRRLAHLTPDDLATIIYTSGTTGHPKGVMLTQRNLLSNAQAVAQISTFGLQSVFLSWLPFSHIYARTVDIYLSLVAGTTLCLAESADTLVANLAEIQPTNMTGVPRFYEKVLTSLQSGDPADLPRRLRSVFGPNIDMLSSGGAPLPLGIAKAYKDAGVLLLQGYGLTESSPVITFNRKDAHKIESVGRAIPDVEVRIGDDGEILTRGPHVMPGYWKLPEETAHALEGDWLHTGDLGRLDDDGYLHITGRKKELLVMSNGKKVVPSQIESVLLADPCIDQVVVCGEGRNFLGAIVVPHGNNLAEAMGVEPHEVEAHAGVADFLTQRIRHALADVAAWEVVRKIVVRFEPFSIARDELTVSLKIRRNAILANHREAIATMYGE